MFVYFGTTRLVDYTSNQWPLCSLTENMVKQRDMLQLSHKSTMYVIHALSATKSALYTVHAVVCVINRFMLPMSRHS